MTSPSHKKREEPGIEEILEVCAIWNTMYITWPREEQEHYLAAFRHSPNFKEGLTRLKQIIAAEQRSLLTRVKEGRPTKFDLYELEGNNDRMVAHGHNRAIDAYDAYIERIAEELG